MTVAAILDATQRVLLTRGYEECTTNLVAEVAGVAIGSLYEYFPNKDALIAGVVERETDDFLAAVSSTMDLHDGKPLAECLRETLQVTFEELDRRRPLLLALMRDFPYLHQLPAVVSLPGRTAELALASAHRWRGDGAIGDEPAASHVLAIMLGAMCVTHMLQPRPDISRERIVEAITQVLTRALGGRPAGDDDAGELHSGARTCG